MAETLIISGGSKADRYATLLPQIESMVRYESDPVALMANISAAIKMTFDFLWVGFYRVEGDELVLAPFQGPLACTRIGRGRGVCGSAWEKGATVVVDDVELFPGHIACSSESRSEIVVPLRRGGEVAGVLDIDSSTPGSFDSTDVEWLERAMTILGAAIDRRGRGMDHGQV